MYSKVFLLPNDELNSRLARHLHDSRHQPPIILKIVRLAGILQLPDSAVTLLFVVDRTSMSSSARELNSVVLGPGLLVRPGGSKGSRKAKLTRNALDAVDGVDVLDQDNLVASCASLARDDSGIGKEVLPDLLHRCQHSRILRND